MCHRRHSRSWWLYPSVHTWSNPRDKEGFESERNSNCREFLSTGRGRKRMPMIFILQDTLDTECISGTYSCTYGPLVDEGRIGRLDVLALRFSTLQFASLELSPRSLAGHPELGHVPKSAQQLPWHCGKRESWRGIMLHAQRHVNLNSIIISKDATVQCGIKPWGKKHTDLLACWPASIVTIGFVVLHSAPGGLPAKTLLFVPPPYVHPRGRFTCIAPFPNI